LRKEKDSLRWESLAITNMNLMKRQQQFHARANRFLQGERTAIHHRSRIIKEN
jgi:hypothetical protein